MGRKTGTLDDL